MRIRTAREHDFPNCLDLDLSYETEFAWQMEELQADGDWGARFHEVHLPRRQRIKMALPQKARLKAWPRADGFWVAVEQRKLIGYIAAVLELDHQQGRVIDLGVEREYRRQGVASELLNKVIDWCSQQSAGQIIFECPLKDHPAINLALKHHFTFCGFQDAYWPEQTAALFFRRRLP